MEKQKYTGYARDVQGYLRTVELSTDIPIHHFLYNRKEYIRSYCEAHGALYPILVPIEGGKS